jgi:phosphonate transport system substrate-binding protein
MRRGIWVLLSILVLIGVAGCTASGASSLTPTEDLLAETVTTVPIVLGDIDSQPTEQIETWQPLADYLAADLQDFGIRVGKVKVAPDMETMGEWLQTGEVDLTFESVYPAMVQMTRYGSEPLLLQWKGGDESYSSVIFTHVESGIASLEDMPGHTIAFEQPSSTSAYFLPMISLLEAGIEPVELADNRAPVPDGKVGYLFSRADANTIQWVLSGRVAAGGTSNQDFQDVPAEAREQLTIVHETRDVPRQLVLARAGLSDEMKERIISSFLALNDDPEGAFILEQFEKTKQFDRLSDDVLEELGRIRTLYETVLQPKEEPQQ